MNSATEITEAGVMAFLERRAAELETTAQAAITLTLTAYSPTHAGRGCIAFAHMRGTCGSGGTLTAAIDDLSKRLAPANRLALASEKRAAAHRLLEEAERLES